MANTIVTENRVAKNSAAILGSKFPVFTQFSREGENEFGQVTNFSNSGDNIRVRVPSLSGTSRTADITEVNRDVKEESVNLTLNLLGVQAETLSSKEMTLDANAFQKTDFAQKVMALGADIQDQMFEILNAKVANTVLVSGTPNKTDFGFARAKLLQGNAPIGSRSVIVDAMDSASVTDSITTQFTSKEKEFTEGHMGYALGADWFEVASTHPVVNGNKVASVTVSGSHAGYANTGTIKLGGLTAGDTFNKGQVFTIVGVNGVNRLNGVTYGTARQFVITADAVATGSTLEVSVFPELKVGAGGYIDALPAAGAAVQFVGGAGKVLTNGFIFHKDAARVAFGVLEPLDIGKSQVYKSAGFGVRIQSGGDILKDVNTTRIDVLAGIAVLRPDWVCKVTTVSV